MEYIFLTALLISLGYLLISLGLTYIALRVRDQIKTNTNGMSNGISILKPLKGLDDCLEENLRSFFEQNYPDFEIIFGVNSNDDPAIPIVRSLQEKYPDVMSKLIIDPKISGKNPKVNNLVNIFKHAGKEFVLISDSNTRVSADYLAHLISECKDKSIGLVLSVLRGVGAANWIAAMENIHLNTYITPNVFAVETLFKRSISIGKSMLIRRSTIKKFGGFEIFGDYLAEDHLIGKKIEEMGLKVKVSSTFVNNVNEKWGLKKILNRHTRWAKMRRSVSLFDYAAETLSNPIPISFIYAVLSSDLSGLIVFSGVCLFKMIYDIMILQMLGVSLNWYYYFLSPVKDLLMGVLWYVPFFSRKVSWRGNKFYIKKDSYLIPLRRTS